MAEYLAFYSRLGFAASINASHLQTRCANTRIRRLWRDSRPFLG